MGFTETIRDWFQKEEQEQAARQRVAEMKKEKQSQKEKMFSIPERPGLFEFPDVVNREEVDIRYDLIPPYAQAHIYWDAEAQEVMYAIEEPDLSAEEEAVLSHMQQAIEAHIETPYSELETEEALMRYLSSLVDKIVAEHKIELTQRQYQHVMYYIYRDFVGLNRIEPLMRDPYIEDIGADGVGVPIFVSHAKLGNIKTTIVYEEEEGIRSFVVKLAERCGKYISYAEPLLDGSLPDGSRVNASFSKDITSRGPTFSIRKFHTVPFSAIDMLDLHTCNADILAYLWLALQYRKNILVIGGVDTGKTSFLNSFITFMLPQDKVVSIEDTRELKIPHENWIPSVARPSYTLSGQEGTAVSMFHLLKESFRQNPDYVIVGEVRGEEASVMFQGMASGHSSMSTMHASSPNSVVKRLITPPINLSPSLIETLDIVLVMTRARSQGKSARRVKSIFEIEGITENQSLRSNELFAWTSIDDSFYFEGVSSSRILDNIRKSHGLTLEDVQSEFRNRKRIVEHMQQEDIRSFEAVADIIARYYRNPDAVLEQIDLSNEEEDDTAGVVASSAPE